MRVFCELDALHLKRNASRTAFNTVINTVENGLMATGFAQGFRQYNKYGQQRRPLGTRTKLVNLLERCPHITLFPEADSDSPSVLVVRGDNALRIFAITEGDKLGEAAEWFVQFTASIYRTCRNDIWLGPTIHVRADLPLPSLRPPRLHDYLSLEASWDIVSQSALAELDVPQLTDAREQHLREYTCLASKRLPRGATRQFITDDLLLIKWVDDDANEAEVRRGVCERAKWLLNNLTLHIAADYSEQGDRLVFAYGVAEHAHVTFYDEAGEAAYQTAVTRKGRIDRKLVTEWKAWLDQHRLPDGSPLRQLNIILPNRQAALATHDQLRDAGIHKVLYVDDEGTWWDPFPEGDWITLDSDDD